jgi:NADPH-dependent 2,4-dienoyl-CoA reductase/sulfur reductase-like enzyme
VFVVAADGRPETVSYDALVVGTGAVPLVPPIAGLTGPGALGPDDGVHVLHTMGETFGLVADIARRQPSTALIVGPVTSVWRWPKRSPLVVSR